MQLESNAPVVFSNHGVHNVSSVVKKMIKRKKNKTNRTWTVIHKTRTGTSHYNDLDYGEARALERRLRREYE